MPKKGYSNLALPTELVNAVRDVVNDHHSLYVSISDFVKEAVRKKLQQYRTKDDEEKFHTHKLT